MTEISARASPSKSNHVWCKPGASPKIVNLNAGETEKSGRFLQLAGQAAGEEPSAQLEIRASWTPVSDPSGDGLLDLGPHAEAWGELVCTASGLPPVPEGVATMPSRRGQRGRG